VPVEAIHLSAFSDSLRGSRAASLLSARPLLELGRLGSLLIDFPYFDRFPRGVARYLLRLPTAVSSWGSELHHGAPVGVVRSLVARARVLERSGESGEAQRVLSLGLGFASHLAVDAELHPLVNRMARARAARLHDSALRQHSEVEKFHSVMFHEERLGFDFMGRRELGEHIRVDAHTVHRDPVLRDAFMAALTAAIGHAPSARLLGRWASGYTQYVWLVSSPAGKVLMSESQKREVREEVYEGAWGTFRAAYAEAVACSRRALDATLDLFQDPASEAAFAVALPSGSIDDLSDGE